MEIKIKFSSVFYTFHQQMGRAIVIKVLVQGIIFSIILVYTSQYGLDGTEKDNFCHN